VSQRAQEEAGLIVEGLGKEVASRAVSEAARLSAETEVAIQLWIALVGEKRANNVLSIVEALKKSQYKVLRPTPSWTRLINALDSIEGGMIVGCTTESEGSLWLLEHYPAVYERLGWLSYNWCIFPKGFVSDAVSFEMWMVTLFEWALITDKHIGETLSTHTLSEHHKVGIDLLEYAYDVVLPILKAERPTEPPGEHRRTFAKVLRFIKDHEQGV